MSSEHRQITGNVNSFNVSTNLNNVVNFVTAAESAAERRQILQWLSPLEPQQRHQDVRTNRLNGIGSWVLETSEFRNWSNEKGGCAEPVLFCYGNPGVGKTYLSSVVIDNLCERAEGKRTATVGLYCDFLAQQEQSSTSMLGAILKQLASRGGIPDHIQEAFRKAKNEFGGRGLRIPDLVEILKKVITSFSRVSICVDALDESAPQHRWELLESLREISRVSRNTRIFLTGRPYIEDEIMRCFSKVVMIPLSPTQEDVASYLEMKLSRDTDHYAMDDELRADIIRVIPEKVSEVLLLVSQNIDSILGEPTLHQRRAKLNQMTKGESLGDPYAEIVSRVRTQQGSRSKLGMQVLMWVSHSERPLHVDELRHALGVEAGSTDLNIRNVPAIETLLACCLGLVTIEKSSSTVHLVHNTLQEYLSHDPDLFLNPHSTIAEVCLTYLNFRKVRGIPPTLYSVPPTMPFAEYASCHWGTHAKRETTERVKVLALELLDGYDKHISSKVLLLHEMTIGGRPFDRKGYPTGFTGLHGAAYFGCVEITVALLETGKWDARETDFDGKTAVAWASRRGHGEVVRILLEWNVNPAQPNKYGQKLVLRDALNMHDRIEQPPLDQADFIHRDAAGLRPTELFPPQFSEPSEPPFKRTRRF